jgi:hypothetical protein
LEALRTSGLYPRAQGPLDALPPTEPMYATLSEFLRGEMNRVWLGPLLDRFPTPAMQTRLATIRTEQEAIETLKQEATRPPRTP